MSYLAAIERICRFPGIAPLAVRGYAGYACFLAAIARRFPEVRAGYVLGSLVDGSVHPGLSDIDLLLVHDCRSPAEPLNCTADRWCWIARHRAVPL